MATHERAMREMVSRALRLGREVESFLARWPETAQPAELSFSWAQVERQLDALASDRTRPVVKPLVSAHRKQSPFLPREMVLRNLLLLAAVLTDDSFVPPGFEEGCAMS